MASLRQRLQLESPELYSALQRSWEIAQKEWLPAVKPSEGSYNSLPHFTNIEHHLENLLGGASNSPATTLRLSTLEVYLLLAAVLFHDFGRVYGDLDHAVSSAATLPEHFAALGIPTREIATSLSRIALYHDPLTQEEKASPTLKKTKLKKAKAALREIHAEPYGEARELYVGTLLALADHMDGSVKRALPRYVEPDDMIGFKGAFRRLVSGTAYDPATYTLKTSLNDFEGPSQFEFEQLYPKFVWKYRSPAEGQPNNAQPIGRAEFMSDNNSRCDLFKLLADFADQPHIKPSVLFFTCLSANRRHPQTRVIERRISVTEQTNERHMVLSVWPADYVLAVVLNDLHVNQSFLNSVKDDLNEMGLPIYGWFAEYRSEVFNAEGNRSSEPVLSFKFLARAVEEMWELGCRLLVGGVVSYEILADSLRIENVALVRLAVQRIAHLIHEKCPSIVAGTTGWRWNKIDENNWNKDSVLGPIKAILSDLEANVASP